MKKILCLVTLWGCLPSVYAKDTCRSEFEGIMPYLAGILTPLNRNKPLRNLMVVTAAMASGLVASDFYINTGDLQRDSTTNDQSTQEVNRDQKIDDLGSIIDVYDFGRYFLVLKSDDLDAFLNLNKRVYSLMAHGGNTYGNPIGVALRFNSIKILTHLLNDLNQLERHQQEQLLLQSIQANTNPILDGDVIDSPSFLMIMEFLEKNRIVISADGLWEELPAVGDKFREIHLRRWRVITQLLDSGFFDLHHYDPPRAMDRILKAYDSFLYMEAKNRLGTEIPQNHLDWLLYHTSAWIMGANEDSQSWVDDSNMIFHLLDLGANPFHRSYQSSTMSRISRTHEPFLSRFVQSLLHNPFFVEKTLEDQQEWVRYFVYIAVKNNSLPLVQSLVSSSWYDVHQNNEEVLYWAISFQRPEIAKYLIHDCNADPIEAAQPRDSHFDIL